MDYSIILKKLCSKNIEEQKKVYEGLCSKSKFEDILEGKKKIDGLLMKYLLERLGKSSEKFELILQIEDYKMIELQEMIKKSIKEKKYHFVEKILKKYEKEIKRGKILELQIISQLKVELLFEKGEYKKALKEIKIALDYTKRNEDSLTEGEELWELPMTAMEIRLQQQKIEVYHQLGEMDKSYEMAKKMERYIEKWVTDEELLASAYMPIILFLARTSYEFHEYERCVFYCKKGIACLQKSRSAIGSPEIFRIKANAMKKGNIGSEKEWKRAYFEACSIESIYNDTYDLEEKMRAESGGNLWEFMSLEK